MPVITIARQFGAGGETVGQLLAARLHLDLLDHQMMREVARRLELPTEEVEAQDEQPGSLLNRLLLALGASNAEATIPSDLAWTPPYADPAFDPRRAVLEITQQVIREAARGDNVVIVGRGAGYLLRDEVPGALHVFLQASKAIRVRTVMERLSLDEEEAGHRVKVNDENRAAYIRQVYGHDWLGAGHYDLVIDTGRIGYEGAVDAIVAAVPGRASGGAAG